MKNQKVQSKLASNKVVETELNSKELATIQGGSTGIICDVVGDIIITITKPIV